MQSRVYMYPAESREPRELGELEQRRADCARCLTGGKLLVDRLVQCDDFFVQCGDIFLELFARGLHDIVHCGHRPGPSVLRRRTS